MGHAAIGCRDVAGVSRKAFQVNWRKETPMNLISDCNRFRINKAFVGGVPVYQAARVIPGPPSIVLGRGTLDECKQACEEAK